MAVTVLLGVCSSAGAQEWSLDGFRALRDQSNTTLAAWAETDTDDSERGRLAIVALHRRLELIEYIETWRESGTMDPAYLSSVNEARVVYYTDVIGIYATEGMCDDAADTLTRLDAIYLADEPSERATAAYNDAVAVSARCEAVEVVIAERDSMIEEPIHEEPLNEVPAVIARGAADPSSGTDEGVTGHIGDEISSSDSERALRLADRRTAGSNDGEASVEVPLDPPQQGRNNAAPIALFSVASASVIGALMWDYTASDDRQNYNFLLEENCSGGQSCPASLEGELNELRDTIQQAKVGTAVLLGVGAAAVLAGTVSVIAGARERSAAGPSSAEVTVAPVLGLRQVGAQVRVDF